MNPRLLGEIRFQCATVSLPPPSSCPVMGIPAVDLATLNGVLEYDSDVVSFHHDCHWEAPRVVNTSEFGLLLVAGEHPWSTSLVLGVEGSFPGKPCFGSSRIIFIFQYSAKHLSSLHHDSPGHRKHGYISISLHQGSVTIE